MPLNKVTTTIAIGIRNNISLFPLIKTSSKAGLTNQACKPVAAAETIIINKAKKILKWKPKFVGREGLEKSLKITLDWFKNKD